jgi:hypothetical protein
VGISPSFWGGSNGVTVDRPAKVSSWAPSMTVTGLMHWRGSHLGHCSYSGKTQAYPRPVVSKGSGPCHVFISKFFQRMFTGGHVFHAWKCFSMGVTPGLSIEKKLKVNKM